MTTEEIKAQSIEWWETLSRMDKLIIFVKISNNKDVIAEIYKAILSEYIPQTN